MAWARFDDKTHDHPKILAAGPLATHLWERAICYCAKHLTDGHIPKRAVRLLVNWEDDADDFNGQPPDNYALIGRLVKVGLFDEHHNDGWLVHDYLDYNPSKAASDALRKARAEAGRKGGRKSRRGPSKQNKQVLNQMLDHEPLQESFAAAETAQPAPETQQSPEKIERPRQHIAPEQNKQVLTGCLSEKNVNQKVVNLQQHDAVADRLELDARKDSETYAPAENEISKCLSKCSSKRSSKTSSRTRTPLSMYTYSEVGSQSEGRSLASNTASSSERADATAPATDEGGSGRPAEIFCTVLLKGNGIHHVTRVDVDRLQDVYSGVDVPYQVKRAAEWCLNNPARRKTHKGVRKFLSGWCARAQEDITRRPPKRVNGTNRSPLTEGAAIALEAMGNG